MVALVDAPRWTRLELEIGPTRARESGTVRSTRRLWVDGQAYVAGPADAAVR